MRTQVLLLVFAALTAGCATDEATFDHESALPSYGAGSSKQDATPRIEVSVQRVGHYVVASTYCEGEWVNYRVTYRNPQLPAGATVILHRGEGGMINECIGDGFCCDSDFHSWQHIDDVEMTSSGDGQYVIETGMPVSRNAERECRLYPHEPANYVAELDFVLMLVLPNGEVAWDTPGNNGYGSYYAAAIQPYSSFVCEGPLSTWDSLATWF